MSENPNNPDPIAYLADQRSHVGQKRPAGRIDKQEWWTDPRAVVRLVLWMQANQYAESEIERMACKPRCYEVEHIQACLEAGAPAIMESGAAMVEEVTKRQIAEAVAKLEAGIALCAESARERRGQ